MIKISKAEAYVFDLSRDKVVVVFSDNNGNPDYSNYYSYTPYEWGNLEEKGVIVLGKITEKAEADDGWWSARTPLGKDILVNATIYALTGKALLAYLASLELNRRWLNKEFDLIDFAS